MFGFDPSMFFGGFNYEINLTVNALANLDTLYIDCEGNEIRLTGWKNGKQTYTKTIKVSE